MRQVAISKDLADSGAHEKRLENLATEITKSRGNEVASLGTSDLGS
jgi:hypothetical protein